MPFTLNPAAAPFVPSCSCHDDELDSEECISQEELDELEAAEDWVALQAGIEEAEFEFLIDMALDNAPPARVAEAERACCQH